MKSQKDMMKLLIYSSDGEQKKRLMTAISQCADEYQMETFMDMGALNQRLRRNCTDRMWLLLVTTDRMELRRMTAMRELIQNTRCILVLPDQHETTLSAGHRLYPRFITYLDSDFSDVGAVLGTIIRKSQA